MRLSGEVVSTRNTMQNISRYLKYLKVSQERDGAPDDPKGQGTQCRTAARSLMRELAAAPALLQTPPTFKKNVKKLVKKLRSLSANSQLRRHYSGTPPIRMHACMYVCMYVCTYVRTYVCLPTLPTLPRLSLFNI